MVVLQLVFTYNLRMKALFHSALLAPADRVAIVAISAGVSLVVGAENWLQLRSTAAVPPPAGGRSAE